MLDTREAVCPERPVLIRGGCSYDLEARSLAVFRLPHEGDEEEDEIAAVKPAMETTGRQEELSAQNGPSATP